MGLMGRGCMETTEGRPCSRPQAGLEPASPQLPWQPAEAPGAAQGLQPSLCHRGREGSRAHRADGPRVLPRKVHGHPGVLQRLWHPAAGGRGQRHRPCCHLTLWAQLQIVESCRHQPWSLWVTRQQDPLQKGGALLAEGVPTAGQ